jgi:PilZ domain-containing protein
LRQPRTSEAVDAQSLSERRLHARVSQRSLDSSLGKVIDLSFGGMRVQSTRRLRGTLSVVIFNPQGAHIRIQARVAWTKRIGCRKHVSGLEFIDLPPSVASELARIATAE